MYEGTVLIAIGAVQTLLLVAFLVEYIRLRSSVLYAVRSVGKKMECDDLIDQLLSEDPPAVALSQIKCDADPEKKRARLAAIVAGGTAKKYLGKQPTLAQIDEMTDVEIQKYYTRYEARLGASMTKTLGNSALQMYALAAGRLLPIPPENHIQLVADLEDDPFVEHALTTACCEMYYRYGMYLAPLTAAMTTAKHCRFGDRACTEIEHGDPDGRDNVGAAGHSSGRVDNGRIDDTASGRIDDTASGRIDDTASGRVDDGQGDEGDDS